MGNLTSISTAKEYYSPFQAYALKGSQDSNGIWNYNDFVTGLKYSYNPVIGTSGASPINSSNSPSGESNSSSSNSINSTSTNSGSSNLFGDGYLGTGVNFDEYVNKMKDLTQWRLGVDKQSMQNAYGFRDKEATRDYGFQTGLAGQQIQGQKDLTGMQIAGQKELQGQQIEGTSNLEKLRNEYMNQRQTQQLDTQKQMQQSGFSQQNKLLSDNANRAKSLFFGR